MTTSAKPIRATVGGRLADYLAEMFPPATYLPSSLANVAAISFTGQALLGRGKLAVTWRAVFAALTVAGLTLLMRLYDELKDVEHDRGLAAAGDPRYLERPIVTGHVRVEDLQLLKWVVTAVLWLINVPLGFPLPMVAFAAVFLLVWASSHWFFWPNLSKSMLLVLFTHNPLALLIGGYVLTVCAVDFGNEVFQPAALVLLVGLWLPVLAWETSRKIRIPADETAYKTYSKLFGWKVAPFVPAVIVLFSSACLIATALTVGLSWLYVVAVAAVTLGVWASALRFRRRPSARTARLQPILELYIVVTLMGLALALGIQHGLRWA